MRTADRVTAAFSNQQRAICVVGQHGLTKTMSIQGAQYADEKIGCALAVVDLFFGPENFLGAVRSVLRA